MALAVHLFLKANGIDIEGDSTILSMERENSIECITYLDHVATQRAAGSGFATGRRVHDPIVLRKRLDRSTPLLFRALCNNEEMEGNFKFFRPAPSGDGSTEHFQTVTFSQGRITDIEREVQNVLDPSLRQIPALEKVSIMFGVVEVTYEPGGVSHEDDWVSTQQGSR